MHSVQFFRQRRKNGRKSWLELAFFSDTFSWCSCFIDYVFLLVCGMWEENRRLFAKEIELYCKTGKFFYVAIETLVSTSWNLSCACWSVAYSVPLAKISDVLLSSKFCCLPFIVLYWSVLEKGDSNNLSTSFCYLIKNGSPERLLKT